jgi:hypothetical protein
MGGGGRLGPISLLALPFYVLACLTMPLVKTG